MFSLLNDTTSKHGTHVFDQNCSICTGSDKTDSTQSSTVKQETDNTAIKRYIYILISLLILSCLSVLIHEMVLIMLSHLQILSVSQ